MRKYLPLALTLALCGCSVLGSGPADAPARSSETPGLAETTKDNIYFAEFKDVPLPRQMDLDRGATIIAGAPESLSGYITLEGRVSASSAFSFFEQTMPGYGWRQRGYFRSAKGLLVFEKPGRDCIISLNEGTIYTRAEIWVIERRPDAAKPPEEQNISELKAKGVGVIGRGRQLAPLAGLERLDARP